MSLVQTMISALLVAIFSLSAMMLLSRIIEANSAAKNTLDFENVVSQIAGFVTNERSCRLAIGGPRNYLGAVDAAVQTFAAAGANTNIRWYMPDAAGAGPDNRQVFIDANPANNANKFGSWTVISVQLQPISMLNSTPVPPPPGATLVPVRMLLEMNTESGLGLGTKRRVSSSVYFTVVKDASERIVSCSGLTYGTGTNLFSAPVCPPFHAMFSDGVRLGCRRIQCSMPFPTPLGGMDAQGNVLCGP